MGLGLVVTWVCSCSEDRSSKEASDWTSPNFDDQVAHGKELYELSCMQCHYEGSGSATAPDLLGSDVIVDSEALIEVILAGQKGVSMRGAKLFNGIMPPQDHLEDKEVAALVVYVRDAFGKTQTPIPVDTVASVRARVKKAQD